MKNCDRRNVFSFQNDHMHIGVKVDYYDFIEEIWQPLNTTLILNCRQTKGKPVLLIRNDDDDNEGKKCNTTRKI